MSLAQQGFFYGGLEWQNSSLPTRALLSKTLFNSLHPFREKLAHLYCQDPRKRHQAKDFEDFVKVLHRLGIFKS